MGRHLVAALAEVDPGHAVAVQRVALVRVHHHHEQPGVGVDHLGLVAALQVPEHGRIVEESEVDHVLAFLKFWRVDLPNLRCLVGELLMGHTHHTFGGRILQVARLQQPLPVASGLGTRDPDRGFRVVGLVVVRALGLGGGHEELRGVWVLVAGAGLGQLDVAGHPLDLLWRLLGLDWAGL